MTTMITFHFHSANTRVSGGIRCLILDAKPEKLLGFRKIHILAPFGYNALNLCESARNNMAITNARKSLCEVWHDQQRGNSGLRNIILMLLLIHWFHSALTFCYRMPWIPHVISWFYTTDIAKSICIASINHMILTHGIFVAIPHRLSISLILTVTW